MLHQLEVYVIMYLVKQTVFDRKFYLRLCGSPGGQGGDGKDVGALVKYSNEV